MSDKIEDCGLEKLHYYVLCLGCCSFVALSRQISIAQCKLHYLTTYLAGSAGHGTRVDKLALIGSDISKLGNLECEPKIILCRRLHQGRIIILCSGHAGLIDSVGDPCGLDIEALHDDRRVSAVDGRVDVDAEALTEEKSLDLGVFGGEGEGYTRNLVRGYKGLAGFEGHTSAI